ncbi:MAG: phosphate--acyl-ACP acyltransferase, partial [Acidobacteriota bacterium]|nr:phosphate--acyl-ACP acyltransferase [Acidobacteriota bacterium]
MGSDDHPKPEVDGAVRAVKCLPVKVLLVGRKDVVLTELSRHEGYRDLPIE